MSKKLINAISKNGVTKEAAKRILQSIKDSISEDLKAGNTAEFFGLGSLKTKDVAGREGRNPKTGEKIDIPAHKRVKFSASKGLKEFIS
jgi:DNA-binding protein HU-beta